MPIAYRRRDIAECDQKEVDCLKSFSSTTLRGFFFSIIVIWSAASNNLTQIRIRQLPESEQEKKTNPYLSWNDNKVPVDVENAINASE